MHLFDIDVQGGVRFKESDVLSAGHDFTTFTVGDDFKIGVGICYDIRFEEMARVYRNDGCDMLIYPAAFNMTTGPMHWELLQRARANDLQLYVSMISPARDVNADYVAWGHSMVVDSWAKIVAEAQSDEEIIYADIGRCFLFLFYLELFNKWLCHFTDTTLNSKVRAQIPVSVQRRPDVYAKKREEC